MSIILVGGHERMESEYKGIGGKYGHRIKVYTQMPPRFEKAIGAPDGMILFTNTVSHKMVNTAIKEAKRKDIPVVRCHNSSSVSLEDSIKQLESLLSKEN